MSSLNKSERSHEARQRCRPVKYPMPERITDTPENIIKDVLADPPKRDWKYLRETGRKQSEPK